MSAQQEVSIHVIQSVDCRDQISKGEGCGGLEMAQ